MKTNKIVLLDDDPNYIRLFAEAYAEAAPEGDELVTFGSEDVCTEYIRRNYMNISALFIDIELKKTNGIELASCITHAYRSIPVVFVSSYAEKYCQDIFLRDIDLTPAAFMTKPADPAAVRKTLDKLRALADTERETLMVKSGGQTLFLPSEEIIYIESSNKTLVIHSEGGDLPINGKLGELLCALPKSFLQCHKSYAVNSARIISFTSRSVTLTGGVRLPVSRGFSQEFSRRLVALKGFGG